MNKTNELKHFRIKNKYGMFLPNIHEDRIKSLIENADNLIESGTKFKHDKTSTVSKTSFDNKDIVIKRYNNKGFFHSFRNSLRQTRAQKSLLNSLLLLDLNIITPNPLGWFVEKKGPLYHRSYFIMECCSLPTLHQTIMANPSDQQWQNITDNIKAMLDKFAANNITHGDLKHSNVLVADEGIGVLDLDVMTVHNNPSSFKQKRKKDISSFHNRLLTPPARYIRQRKQKFPNE